MQQPSLECRTPTLEPRSARKRMTVVSAPESTYSLNEWFSREVLCHEEALTRFLVRAWSRRHEILDVRQEAYLRVYVAAQIAKPKAPRAFLFATARNLLTDYMRRAGRLTFETGADDSPDVLVDEISPEQHALADQELSLVSEAIDRLPIRCRQAVWMRRVDALPQREVAMRLGVTEKAVEKHLSKGMQRLAQALAS